MIRRLLKSFRARLIAPVTVEYTDASGLRDAMPFDSLTRAIEFARSPRRQMATVFADTANGFEAVLTVDNKTPKERQYEIET